MTAAAAIKRYGFFGKLRMKFLRRMASSFPHQKVRCMALRSMGFEIGDDVYIAAELGLAMMNSDNSCHLKLGDRVSIGPRVMLVLASDPNNSKLIKIFPPVRGTIVIEDDAWLGANVTELPNITIGKCSVVASGAVVTEDVAPYTLAGGVPARKLKDLPKGDLQ